MFPTLPMRHLAIAAGIGALMVAAAPAMAADLTMGFSSEPQSIDPLFSRTGPNQTTAGHIFGRLMERDEKGIFQPSLAESWKNLDSNTWEVKLRQNVKFHDGSPFTAEDVVFSIERAPKVPNSPASFEAYVRSIKSMQIVDPHTIRFTSASPDPTFMQNVGGVFIISKKVSETATTADFNSGKAAIGTGPYKFVSWTPGDRLQLVRNDAYWGAKPEWEKVTVRYISNDPARVAALLSGAVDVIDQVPPTDIPTLQKDNRVGVFNAASVRLIYMVLNQRDDAPGIASLDGKPLPKNPYQDARVRQAISLMIDRAGIVDKILFGQGVPTNNQVPEGILGYNADLKPKYDVAAAKKLLADAGFATGFSVNISGSNDRFLLDGDLTQGIGQMLARGGLKVAKVEALPYSVFSKAAGENGYGAWIFSNGNSAGEAGRGLEGMLHTPDKERKLGSLNRHNYSNPLFDKAIVPALDEFDDAKRWKMQADAAAIAINDGGMIPLYHQAVTWATRKGFSYAGRRDESTYAMSTKSVK